MKTRHFFVLLFLVSSCINSPYSNVQDNSGNQEPVDTVAPDSVAQDELVVQDSSLLISDSQPHSIDLPCTHGFNSLSECPICSTRGIRCPHGYGLEPYKCPLCSSEKYRSLSEEEQKEVERVYNQKHARDRINDALNEIEFQQSINDAARRLIK
ncbi:MAG: hypothetical protein IJ550_07510 [Bacteroidaceae bacterium]|jgi:hypothetical protein|nr:hypothetical protein [Bacteroidaceae bacterium]